MKRPSTRVVVMLGGNAFASGSGRLTMPGQFRFAHQALSHLRPLLCGGVELLITHGNGPQVGHILTRVEQALGKAYSIPLEVCVAESEGELGYVLEQTIHNLMADWGCSRPIASVLTQVLVESSDAAFQAPTKPIGPYYNGSHVEELSKRGFQLRSFGDRGYRRVVPSPRPIEILETDVIGRLLDWGAVVIAAGGGGIPVVRDNGKLRGVEAVVDKDLSSALLAKQLNADLLLIVTNVSYAYTDYERPSQRAIEHVSVAQARLLADEGHFAPGTMGPKIEAAIQFVESERKRAIICDAQSIEAACHGEAGTIIDWENGHM